MILINIELFKETSKKLSNKVKLNEMSMKKIEDKMNTISLLESFTNEMFNRYYITDPPILKEI